VLVCWTVVVTATVEQDESEDEQDRRDRPPTGMFSLPQTIALVVLAAVVAVGLTLFFTADEDPSFNDVDIGFLADMTTHHQGALTLGFDYLPNQNDDVIAHTAREVILAQSQEIATMNSLIGEAGEDAERIENDSVAMEWMGHPVDPGDMPGMASAGELAALSAATGLAADDLFSRLMIAHHAAGAEMSEYAAENGDVELGGVGEMLEDGARGYTGHLGDVAHDRRHFAGDGERERRTDDGFTCARDAVAASGSGLQLLRVSDGFDIHYTDVPGFGIGDEEVFRHG